MNWGRKSVEIENPRIAVIFAEIIVNSSCKSKTEFEFVGSLTLAESIQSSVRQSPERTLYFL